MPSQALNVQDLFSVSGRVALVTGGTSGIGLMIARGLVAAGAKVYIVARNAEACRTTATELSSFGSCTALPGDLSTLAGIQAIAAGFSKAESKLHILVNNAGVLWDQPIDEFSEEGWDSVLDTNLKGVFFLTQQLLPSLRKGATEAAPAAIVNIGSVGGLRVGPRETYSYAAAKAGLHHMTKSLAKRLGPENITVNALAPGFFPSRLTPADSEVLQQAVKTQVPRRRIGELGDIAGATIFLGSRAGAFVTGTIISVDGGMSV